MAAAPYAVVIPARFSSTRLPAKPLLRETGKYLIQHVVERAMKAPGVARVIVATDDDRIEAAVNSFGGEAIRTDPKHASGTERCAEVAARLDLAVVINVQGDEPRFEPRDLAALAEAAAAPGTDIATLAFPITNPADGTNTGVVKVATRPDGVALYFSRSPIPFDRSRGGIAAHARAHVGIYAFPRKRLLEFPRLPASPNSEAESLEQLRALDAGWRIVVLPATNPAFGIDTPDDYARFVAAERGALTSS